MAKARIVDLWKAGQRNFYALPFEKQLDYLCTKFEVKPIGYFDTPKARIYIAEGWLARRPEDGTPGWTVLYAIRRRGQACIAQAMYMQPLVSREARIQAALAAAASFLREEDGAARRVG